MRFTVGEDLVLEFDNDRSYYNGSHCATLFRVKGSIPVNQVARVNERIRVVQIVATEEQVNLYGNILTSKKKALELISDVIEHWNIVRADQARAASRGRKSAVRSEMTVRTPPHMRH